MTSSSAVRLLLTLLVLLPACGFDYVNLPRGTLVPAAELRARQSDEDAFIVEQIVAGEGARAFYALELKKTRPFAVQRLLARSRRGQELQRAQQDLRPIFRSLVTRAGQGDRRGLSLTGPSLQTIKQHDARGDELLWKHLELFEKRTNPQKATSLAIPYSYAARHSYGITTQEETALLFSADEAFISFHVHEETVHLFYLRGSELTVHRLTAPATRLRSGAAALHAAVSNADPAGRNNGWKLLASDLYRELLGPAVAAVSDSSLRSIYISPDDFIANVPFGVLLESTQRPLLERLRVTYLPSASMYRALLGRPLLNEAPRLLAIGNPRYPEGIAPLVNAEKEATTVSEIFAEAKLLTGARATETVVTERASEFNILHFATHGVLLGRAIPDASSLLLTSDDAHDGFLTAGEISRLDLTKNYVAVLSACETSARETGVASGELGSITSAFLSAGAPSVIGSLWKVDDAGTTSLMLSFYQSFLEVGAGEALRKARLELSKREGFEHPYFWGAFVLYGWEK